MTGIVVSTESTITSSEGPHVEVVVGSNGQISLGEWFWRARDDADGEGEWLGCITEIGTNYVFLREPDSKSGYHCERILLSDCGKMLRRELHIENVPMQRVTFHQTEAAEALAQVQAITARLGVSRQPQLSNDPDSGNSASRSLAVLASTSRVEDYKTDLVRAKEVELPALFEIIRTQTNRLHAG